MIKFPYQLRPGDLIPSQFPHIEGDHVIINIDWPDPAVATIQTNQGTWHFAYNEAVNFPRRRANPEKNISEGSVISWEDFPRPEQLVIGDTLPSGYPKGTPLHSTDYARVIKITSGRVPNHVKIFLSVPQGHNLLVREVPIGINIERVPFGEAKIEQLNPFFRKPIRPVGIYYHREFDKEQTMPLFFGEHPAARGRWSEEVLILDDKAIQTSEEFTDFYDEAMTLGQLIQTSKGTFPLVRPIQAQAFLKKNRAATYWMNFIFVSPVRRRHKYDVILANPVTPNPEQLEIFNAVRDDYEEKLKLMGHELEVSSNTAIKEWGE